MSEPDNLQLVDTTILIHAHDISARQKHVCARGLVQGLWQSGEGCPSIQVLQEFYVNVTQKIIRPMSPDAAARIVADLAVWQIHRPGVEDVLDAIQLQERYKISFRNAMIVNSAIHLGCHQPKITHPRSDLNERRGIDERLVFFTTS